MLNRDKLARLSLVALAAVATTATAGTTGSAQTTASTGTTASTETAAPATAGPAASDKAAPELTEIVVTGSLIKRVNAETTEALTVLKVDTLQTQGITNVEQVLNTLTSSNSSLTVSSSVGQFTGGGSYANLRGLGNGRTLVLLDGERLANNAFSGLGVDLSGIPLSALETVDVLRQGAQFRHNHNVDKSRLPGGWTL